MTYTPGHRRINDTYWEFDEFLKDLRAGTLKECFYLEGEVWQDLMENINTDPAFAGEIIDKGILMLMAADSGFEIDGLMELAEVCRVDGVKEN
jgi:hypothetical protein